MLAETIYTLYKELPESEKIKFSELTEKYQSKKFDFSEDKCNDKNTKEFYINHLKDSGIMSFNRKKRE